MRHYVKTFLIVVVLAISCFLIYSVTVYGSNENTASGVKHVRESTLLSVPSHNNDIETCTPNKNQDQASCDSFTETSDSINVVITFTNADKNVNLQNKFSVTVASIFQFASRHISLCLISDKQSESIARTILSEKIPDSTKYSITSLDIRALKKDYEDVIKPFQQHFSHSPGSYYSDILFFLSVALHRILPTSVDRVIILDSDLRFRTDIANLYDMFDKFRDEMMIGLAHEQQPVYRHTFYQYRNKHPGTRVGEAGPAGLAGFNSGVLLLDLKKMRRSELYNSFLTAESLQQLSTEFGFKGHLGDQDFFTLLGMKFEQLFFTLPCQWNRQLCEWWRRVYPEVFDIYHKCEAEIMIYHGNCNTPIPDD